MQLTGPSQRTNWGNGLPVAGKNQDNWPIMQPLLADLGAGAREYDVFHSAEQFREMLRIRKSSRLFRLEYADRGHGPRGFPQHRAGQIPGLIVMSISDDYGSIDLANERIVTLFNAADDPVVFGFSEIAGGSIELHPVQATSVEPVVRTATYDAASGAFNVPARTTAVFLVERPVVEQIDFLEDQVNALEDDDSLNRGQARALKAKLRAAKRSVLRGKPKTAANQIGAFINQVQAFVSGGVLSAEEGEALLASAETTLESLG